MCQTLLFIPHRLFGLPVFGLGWFLIAWVLVCLVWIGWRVRASGWSAEAREPIPFFLVVAAAITFLFPMLEAKAPDGEVLGLPIRGYGTLLLLGVLAGWWLAARRAIHRGLNVDTIASLGLWVFVAGIVGARAFFVVEYWPEFRQPTWQATLWRIATFTEGGLVVYGSLIGGFLAYAVFALRRKVPMLVLGDIIAPGVILGMAIGRLGCLMNGCCYGGLSEEGAVGMRFPRFSSVKQHVTSPPYLHQLANGQIHGFTLGANQAGQPIVKSVDPGMPADRKLTAGARLAKINGNETPTLEDAQKALVFAGPEIVVELADGQRIRWSIGSLPTSSRLVHPVQIYSAISGMLICLVLLSSEPFINRNGAVMAMFLTLYPVIRYLEEMIRDDEPGQLGTELTIAQLVSIGVFIGGVIVWICVVRFGAANDRRAAASVAH